jgi:hypothetical protein
MATESVSLAESLPREMARVRDELMPLYQQIGPPGAFALMLMRKALDEAAEAMVSGDVIAMLRVYEDLKGFKA